jgi:hypothetical protein
MESRSLERVQTSAKIPGKIDIRTIQKYDEAILDSPIIGANRRNGGRPT